MRTLIIFVASYFMIAGTLIPVSPAEAMSFDKAVVGDIWQVWDEIGFYKTPEIPQNDFALKRNTIGVLKPGSKFEILDEKGFLSKWYKVLLYDKDTMTPIIEGWIYAAGIKDKRFDRIIKSASSPFN